MDPARLGGSSRQGSDICSGNDRKVERRATIAQMMAENREGLGMKVVAVMVQRYGVLPREMWDLNSISDMGAARGITYRDGLAKPTYESILENGRYTIVNLTIGKDVSCNVELPHTVRRLNIMAERYNYPLDLPATLLELIFEWDCGYNKPMALPVSLRKLKLGNRYSQQLNLPPQLAELEIGCAYNRPLALPPRLKCLTFRWSSQFNFPIALPPSLVSVQFGRFYNQPTVLPSGLETVRVGTAFTHDLSFPSSLRKIVWWCNCPIKIPEGVAEVNFGTDFTRVVVLPTSLKKVEFRGHTYSHPLNFPTGLEDIFWVPREVDALVLPEGLQKLTWWPRGTVNIPVGLRELVVGGYYAPLVLPEGLRKVTFAFGVPRHYNLPESVQEVSLTFYPNEKIFTHPTILQHLIMKMTYNGDSEIDLSLKKIHKLTIENHNINIKGWPQGLKELEFTIDDMRYPLRVPEGCRIVGEKRPVNIIME